MKEKIILYTTHCSRCNILKQKLDQSALPYETVEDTKIMLSKGMLAAPALEVDGTLLNFAGAMKWVESFRGNEVDRQ